MKQKKLVSLLLSLSLLFSLSLPARGEEPSAAPFPDVEGHWAQSVLEKWHAFGVIAGDTWTGAFRPDDSLSRAEFATLLNRIMGYPLVEIKHFSDVPADTWYAETMSRLNSAGIIQGDGNNMVRPKDPVTRQEAAVILCRALDIPEQTASVSFLDADEIAPWAQGAVGALYDMGAIQGWEGYFDPQGPISRCQAVTLLNNLIGAVMTLPGTMAQDVSGDLYICTKRARLENMTVTGDLILTPGVATGDVVLSGVRVKGDLIIRGGGEKSVHIQEQCKLEGDVILAKTAEGAVRLVNESESPIPSVRISQGLPPVILEGDITSLTVACSVPVILQKGKVETLSISAPKADLTLEKECSVSGLTIEKDAKDANITVAGTVDALTSHAAATVTSSGKILSAHAAASGLVLAGTRPEKITMISGILRPKDGNGKVFTDIVVKDPSDRSNSSKSSGGSSSGGSSSGGSSSGGSSSGGSSSGGSSSGGSSSGGSSSGGSSSGGSSSGGSSGGDSSGTTTPTTPEKIASAFLSIAAPVFKCSPSSATTADTGYTIVSTVWQNEDGSPATYCYKSASDDPDIFTTNHIYQAVVTLAPNTGRSFDSPENMSVKFGSTDADSVTANGSELVVKKLFPPTEKKDFVTLEDSWLTMEKGKVKPIEAIGPYDVCLVDPATLQYQWSINDTPVSGAMSNSYLVTSAEVEAAEEQSGSYKLTCTITAPDFDPVCVTYWVTVAEFPRTLPPGASSATLYTDSSHSPNGISCTLYGASDLSALVLESLPTSSPDSYWPDYIALDFSSGGNLLLNMPDQELKPSASSIVVGRVYDYWDFDGYFTMDYKYGELIDDLRRVPNPTVSVTLYWADPSDPSSVSVRSDTVTISVSVRSDWPFPD